MGTPLTFREYAGVFRRKEMFQGEFSLGCLCDPSALRKLPRRSGSSCLNFSKVRHASLCSITMGSKVSVYE